MDHAGDRPAAPPDLAPLYAAVDAAADVLRGLPESALRRGAAARGLALARELALRAQRLEDPARPPRELPDAGAYAVGDQVAVAGHDLAHALRHLPAAEAARERDAALDRLRTWRDGT
ncbi:hypothetical protein [Streptomyces hoynatensis]|uniref:Uncharacterized protein n=1 Tax=Streptomyces hoynatensis TaxID=1141874 RepID=A0A3A9YQ46_9ACTN|nr:hypothetical protein [Streptomyces hoynatensis]RKN37366.1 hypothetical protein D7294_27900 [Streptomyces hoynatensis]